MASSIQPPPAMTDPLNMGMPDAAEQAATSHEQDEIERQQKAMEQGMPARNLKKVGVLVLGIVAAGYMVYPMLFPSRKASPVTVAQPIGQVDKTAAGAIVEQLKSQPAPKPQVDQISVALKKEPTPGPSAGLSDTDRPMLAREQEFTRKDTITASGMEPADFSLPNKDAMREKTSRLDEPSNILARALKDQSSILEKSLTAAAASGDAGVNGGQRRSVDDDFILKTRSTKLEEPTRLAPPRIKAALYQGTIIQVVLDRAINTDNPGVARGRVRSDVYDSVTQETLLIPRGSIVILPYLNSVLVGQARILVAGERLIFPNGQSFSLSGTIAGDMQGASGLPADIDNHFYEMFKTSFIIGAASLLLPKNQQQISVSETAGGNSQTGGSILGTTLYNTIQRISERNSTIKPTASVEVGEPFTLMLSKDIEMEPYRGKK